ncbi:hypothetical protein EDE05_1276 [Neorhizobium sp. R1-B]|uniref:hypothetical protein n=1 Tax=unclassified Neorhizobium TaxID=2629175 RepID=UPI000DDA3A35|nr:MULTISPECIES: hypothetical protein [unclassified Neorhizobium]TCV60414.1 hypothetical protein EDE09_1296 [Neorhizobium sp. S3-V5DH]TDX72803.1 hypothetical protein EDE05_1276 [Neorhizobium sp. R1-B]
MKKAFALAILMSTATIGSTYARDMGSAVRPATDFSIVYTDPEIDNSANRLDIPDSIVHPTPAMIRQAQAKLDRDSALRAGLLQKNVELNNVVGIDTAADGSRIVYIR